MPNKKDFYTWLDSIGVLYPDDDSWLEQYTTKHNFYCIMLDEELDSIIRNPKTPPKLRLQALQLAYARNRDLSTREATISVNPNERQFKINFNVNKLGDSTKGAIETKVEAIEESLKLESFDFES